MRPARAPVGLGLVVLLVVLPGCAGKLTPAMVPDSLLGGNGWQRDAQHSDAQQVSEGFGLSARQTLAYADDAKTGNGGYPASLALTTLKLSPTPGEAQLRDLVQEQVRKRATEQGIQVGNQVTQGSRTLGDGHGTLWFLFTGTVTGKGALFTTTNATAQILGEVWNCPEAGTSVAAVGLAQVSSAQSVGGVALPPQENKANWRELAADPPGTVDGQRGSDGLLYNALCKP